MDPRVAFFDQEAQTWETRCYSEPVRARLVPLVEMFHIQRGARVLDMGTGTGILHSYLLEAVGETGQVVAFDLSFQMLQKVRKKPHSAHLVYFQASAMELPLQNNLFDLIICFATFPHFADKQAALREMARVAKRGAEVTIAHLLSRDELWRHHSTHPAVAQDRLPEDDAMRRLFVAAGLTTPDIHDEPGLYLARATKI
jgi:ubiquinone/menaquinone biosynthesis C-methylase UbiE